MPIIILSAASAHNRHSHRTSLACSFQLESCLVRRPCLIRSLYSCRNYDVRRAFVYTDYCYSDFRSRVIGIASRIIRNISYTRQGFWVLWPWVMPSFTYVFNTTVVVVYLWRTLNETCWFLLLERLWYNDIGACYNQLSQLAPWFWRSGQTGIHGSGDCIL